MTEYYIVWNSDRSEGFITDNADAAAKAAGRAKVNGIESTLGGYFRETYGDDGKAEVQPFIIHKPLSRNAEKLLKRIQNGGWYPAFGKKTPKAMQELIDHKLVYIMGRVVTIAAAYVADGHTPFVMDIPPGRDTSKVRDDV